MAVEWVDGFLKITDVTHSGEEYSVEGEAQDQEFLGAIEITSFEMGSTTAFDDRDDYYEVDPITSVGGLFDDANEEDTPEAPESLDDHDACQFKIEKLFDYSSPDLFNAWCLNEGGAGEFTKATVSLRKA